MVSVTRDKKKIVSAGRGIAQSKKGRATSIAEDDVKFYRDNDRRIFSDHGYHTGRVEPVIDNEEE